MFSKQEFVLVAALGAILVGVISWGSNSKDHVHGPLEESLKENGVQGERQAVVEPSIVRKDLERLSLDPAMLDSVASIAHRKIHDEGGLMRSLDYLEQLYSKMAESGKKAPFEMGLDELQRFGGATLPSEGVLWTMSVESMELARELMLAHAEWIGEYSLAPTSDLLHVVSQKMNERPMSLPPEAIAMAFSGKTWIELVDASSSLPLALGKIREDYLVRYGEIYTNVWCIESLVYQAALEAGVDFPDNANMTILDSLGEMYAPLGGYVLELKELPDAYLRAIETELVASGIKAANNP